VLWPLGVKALKAASHWEGINKLLLLRHLLKEL
jgi:hypothetical protein